MTEQESRTMIIEEVGTMIELDDDDRRRGRGR